MYQENKWKVSTAPASEPITLAEAKLYLRVDTTADDALITALITAARETVELQNVTEAQSTSGFPAETWATLATVWAEVKYNILPSKEDAMADKTTAVGVVTFRIRLRTDINEKTRILYRANYYTIVAIKETPGREFQIIQGEKRVK